MGNTNVDPKVYQLDVGVVKVTVEGLTPLVMNAWDEETAQEIEDIHGGKGGSKRAKRRPLDPQEEFERARYRDKDGNDLIKAAAFKEAMVSAIRNIDGLSMVGTRPVFWVDGNFLTIKAEEPEMVRDRVRYNNGRGATGNAYRPYYWPWEVNLKVTFRPSKITTEQLLYVLQEAGWVGVGAWRTECKGDKGRFQIKPGAVDITLPEEYRPS